jgi:hypothetical protein
MRHYRPEQAAADFAEVERDMRQRLGETLDMCAKFDEEIVDRDSFGLGRTVGRSPARRPSGSRRSSYAASASSSTNEHAMSVLARRGRASPTRRP